MKNKHTSWIDPVSMKYHLSQWESPKESTKTFSSFFQNFFKSPKNIIDIGCGAGSVTSYLAKKNPNVNFIGIEYEKKLVKIANRLSKDNGINNVFFEFGNMFQLKKRKDIDGIICLQTISWVDGFEKPLFQMFKKFNPNFIALTGLFYNGDITCKTEVEEFTKKSRKVFYNTYSIKSVERFCNLHGYGIKKSIPFEIGIDLKKPKNKNILGTYTEKILLNNGKFKRIQISGPLLLNWYTILIKKL
jgi:ubiquinone/menaquinone biosynthesis C-methylase UbiE